MNKKIFAEDIKEADKVVKDFFVVTSKNIFHTRDNKKYISLSLKDRSGTIEGRVWDEKDVERLGFLFERGDIIWVDSVSSIFQERPQLKIRNIQKTEEVISIENMKDFYPSTDRTEEELTNEFERLVSAIKNPYLKSLFGIFSEMTPVFQRFLTYPASIGVHHMYIGGLMEHSLAVAAMGEKLSGATGGDRDIVIAGSLLHDIGKIDEIELKGGFAYSDRGRLLGHISLGVTLFEILKEKIPGFPGYLADVLTHIIVSHHGQEEWGSPRKPMCIEALVVHYLDNLDAKVMGVKEHMAQNMEDDRWTEYHRLYESRFYKIPER